MILFWGDEEDKIQMDTNVLVNWAVERHRQRTNMEEGNDLTSVGEVAPKFPGRTVRADVRLDIVKLRMSVWNYPCNYGYR